MRSVAAICACLALGPGAASASAAGWPAPEDVFGLSKSITDTPRVALDAAGNAVAIGLRDDDGETLVEAIERPAGGEWSESVVLSDPDEENPTATQVGVDAAGNAVAVWSAWIPGYAIQAASRPAGGEWSDPEPLGGNPFPSARPHLAMNAAGDAVATWTGFDDGEVVVAAVLPAGGEWSEPEKISAGTEEGRFPQVGIDAEGNAIAVWQQIDPGENIVRAATLPAGDEWSEPEDLSATGDNATAPRIAVDAAGNAVAVWSVIEGGDGSVHAKTRPAEGDWSGQEDVSAAGEVAGEAEVAIDANGAVATWTATVGDDQIMRGAVLPAGAEEWSEPENVSSPIDQFQSSDLETNVTAGAIAIWTRFDEGNGNSVQASVRPPGGEWSNPEDLSAEGREAGLADLAFDPTGNSIALWGTGVEGGYVAQATGYDFFAPRLDDVLIPTSGKVGEPVAFAVSPFDFFPLDTSWSFGDGSSAGGNTVSHVYATPGAHPVTVSVVDGGGNTSTRTAAIAIAGSTNPPPPRRLTALVLRIEKKSLRGLRRSGSLTVNAGVDSAASATLNGLVRLRAQGKAPRLVPIFVRKTVRFAAAGEQAVQLTLSERGRKVLRPLTKARIRIEGEASDLADSTATDSAARTLRD